MTRISFLHGAHDRIQASVQWLHRAWAQRQAVFVYAPEAETARQLDRALWAHPPLGFTPHCMADAPLAAETPILIAASVEHAPQDQCMLNLSNDLPTSFSRFEHVVEIVSTDDADRLPARDRYKFYRDRGYAIENRDISGGL